VDLKEPKSANIIHGLQKQLFNLAWNKDDTVGTFWSRLMAIVDKIQATGKEVDPSIIISRVIVSLPERFDMFKSNWEYNASSDATVLEFKQKLLQAELGLKEKGPKDIMETAFQAGVKDPKDLNCSQNMAASNGEALVAGNTSTGKTSTFQVPKL
jgi:hypothetical protein